MAALPELQEVMNAYFLDHAGEAGVGLEVLPGVVDLLTRLKAREGEEGVVSRFGGLLGGIAGRPAGDHEKPGTAAERVYFMLVKCLRLGWEGAGQTPVRVSHSWCHARGMPRPRAWLPHPSYMRRTWPSRRTPDS